MLVDPQGSLLDNAAPTTVIVGLPWLLHPSTTSSSLTVCLYVVTSMSNGLPATIKHHDITQIWTILPICWNRCDCNEKVNERLFIMQIVESIKTINGKRMSELFSDEWWWAVGVHHQRSYVYVLFDYYLVYRWSRKPIYLVIYFLWGSHSSISYACPIRTVGVIRVKVGEWAWPPLNPEFFNRLWWVLLRFHYNWLVRIPWEQQKTTHCILGEKKVGFIFL